MQLLDHEALLRGDIDAAVRRVARDAGPQWYRGWMIPVARHDALARAMTERGAPLVVHSPPRHRLCACRVTLVLVHPSQLLDEDWFHVSRLRFPANTS